MEHTTLETSPPRSWLPPRTYPDLTPKKRAAHYRHMRGMTRLAGRWNKEVVMRCLILAAALLPSIAFAQSAPPQFCISPTLAQTLAAALQQDAAMLALLNDAAQEPQRQAAAISAAVAKQKADDQPAAKTGAVAEIPATTAHVPNLASPAPATPSTRP